MPAQRPLPFMQPIHGETQTARPAGPLLPARKAGTPAPQSSLGGLHSAPRLPEQRQQTPLSLLKASPAPGTPRPAHVVVVGEKAWAAPSQVSASKNRVVSPGQHSMINVDARSAPRGPAPQGLAARAAPWASGQPIPARDRPAVSSPSPMLLPMTSLGRPQSIPLNASQGSRVSVIPTRCASRMQCDSVLITPHASENCIETSPYALNDRDRKVSQ